MIKKENNEGKTKKNTGERGTNCIKKSTRKRYLIEEDDAVCVRDK